MNDYQHIANLIGRYAHFVCAATMSPRSKLSRPTSSVNASTARFARFAGHNEVARCTRINFLRFNELKELTKHKLIYVRRLEPPNRNGNDAGFAQDAGKLNSLRRLDCRRHYVEVTG